MVDDDVLYGLAPEPAVEPEVAPHARPRLASAPSASLLERGSSSLEEGFGSLGVTGNPEREKELGAGKWTEQGRSLQEIARQLPSTPTREMDLVGGGPPWWAVVAAAALLAVGAAAWLSSDAQVFSPPTIQITTDPAGARVVLDDRDRGPAPATVEVPDDDRVHTLCVHKGDINVCRELRAEELASDYHFDAD